MLYNILGDYMIFKKRKEKKLKKQNNAVNENLIEKIRHKSIKYAAIRKGFEYGETIIMKSGRINITDDEIVLISSESGTMFRKPLSEVKLGQLQSLGGATIQYIENGESVTVTAYYTVY